MSASAPPRKVLARNIDEENALPHDLLISYASSIPSDRLSPLQDWLRAGSPTAPYTGPPPTYQLKLDWSEIDDEGPVMVVNRAMERCFGSRGVDGWQIFIRGDQLNLLMSDVRKEYLRLKAMEHSQIGLLDLWIEVLLMELKRIHALPTTSTTTSPSNNVDPAAPTLLPPEGSQRRSSRSPSRPLGLDQTPFPRVLPTEVIGKPPGTKATTTAIRKPSSSPSTTTIINTSSIPKKAVRPAPVPSKARPASPRPPTMSPSIPHEGRDETTLPSKPPPGLPLDPISTTPFIDPRKSNLEVPSGTRSLGPSTRSQMSPVTTPKVVDSEPTDVNSEPTDVRELADDSEKETDGEADVEEGDGFGIQSTQETQETQDDTDEFHPNGDEQARSTSESVEDLDEPRRGSSSKKSGINKKSKSKQTTKKRITDVFEISDDGSPASDVEAIFVEPSQGPARSQRAARIKEAQAKRDAPRKKLPKGSSTRITQTKRKADASKAPSASKRRRVDQLAHPLPHTPETTSNGTRTPRTASQAGTDFEQDTPTPKNGETIWDFYIDRTTSTDTKNRVMECRACGKTVKGQSTSNFHIHQRYKCPNLAEAARQGIPGIMCDLPLTGSQSTINQRTGALVQPFHHRTFLDKVMKWIIVSGLPFTTIENVHLQAAFQAANQYATLQSARTLARRLEDTWDVVNDKVLAKIRKIPSVIHFSHDSWTDSGRKNSYFGVYVTFINEDWRYEELLLRLIHMKGIHSGERMGDGLFDLFDKTVGCVGRLGPGTADNASNNTAAAYRLAGLIKLDGKPGALGQEILGCVCHIANIAALKYLENEASLSLADYAYNEENIPEVRVMGQTAFWSAELEGKPDEEDVILCEQPEVEDNQQGEENPARTLGASADADEDEEEAELSSDEDDVDSAEISPVDLVHRLAVYVHSSPKRKEEFEKARAKRDPDTPKGLLPLKDVVTRWNSKEAAITRVLRLRRTVESYTAQEHMNNKKCPRFTKGVFDALQVIQPTLKIFLQLTLTHSEVGSNVHRIIPDLQNAMDELKKIHKHPSVSASRRESSEAAYEKLLKYMNKFLVNKWPCAAFALDPTVRDEGLQKLLTRLYAGGRYYEKTVKWIKKRTAGYRQQFADGSRRVSDEVELVNKPKRVNRFASTKFQAGNRQEVTHDTTDAWACYNSEVSRYATFDGETPLAYWKRMNEYQEMKPLALVARDLLGMASSTASVERLFSHAGHVLGRKRGSLSAKLLSKQVMLRMWDLMGLLTGDELVAAETEEEDEAEE